MTAEELRDPTLDPASPAWCHLIGRVGSLRVDSGPMYLDVRIVAYKRAYGTERVFVEPVAGSGGVWVNLDRVALTSK